MSKYELCRICGLPVQEGEHICKRCESADGVIDSELDFIHDPEEDYVLHDNVPDALKKNPEARKSK